MPGCNDAKETQKLTMYFGTCSTLVLTSLASTSAIAEALLREEIHSNCLADTSGSTEQGQGSALDAQSPFCVCSQVSKSCTL